MNELFLSGTILTLVKTPTTGDTSHVVCQLRHSHRNRQQQVIPETYTVHAWNRLADWAAQTLKPGARVYVKGYLTQKLRGDVTMTDVTAAQFCPEPCWDGCGESAGKLRKSSVLHKQRLYIQDKNVKRNGGGFLSDAPSGIVHGVALHA